MSKHSATQALLFGEYTFPTRNRLAAGVIERFTTLHANADSFVGLMGPVPGITPEAVVLLTQLAVYKGLARELTAIYEAPLEDAVRSYLAPSRPLDVGSGAWATLGDAPDILASQFGPDFLAETAPDLAQECAEAPLARLPFVGISVPTASAMIWRVGIMASIYCQNRSAWVGDRKETYQRAKLMTGKLGTGTLHGVNLDDIPRKVVEVFESQVGLVVGYVERLRKMSPASAAAAIRKQLQGDHIPNDLTEAALDQIESRCNKDLKNVDHLHNRDSQDHELGERAAGVTEEVRQSRSGNDLNWAERVRAPVRAVPEPIRLEEVSRAESEAYKIQMAGIELVQRTLQGLAGRRPDPKEGKEKEIADRARKLAKRFGVSLHFNQKPVYFKWANGVFAATTTDSSHEHIDSSAEFLPLTVPEADLPAPGAVAGTSSETHAQKAERRSSKKGPRPK